MRRVQGKTKSIFLPKKASTAWAEGAMLIFDASGYVTKATSSSTKLLGLSRKTIAATDTDYASTTEIPVEVPVEDYVIWEAAAVAAVVADVGIAVDLTDELTVDRSGTTHHVVTIIRVVSATKVEFLINAKYSSYAGA